MTRGRARVGKKLWRQASGAIAKCCPGVHVSTVSPLDTVMTTAKRTYWMPRRSENSAPPLLLYLDAFVLAAFVWFLASPHAPAQPAIPEGVWIMDARVQSWITAMACEG